MTDPARETDPPAVLVDVSIHRINKHSTNTTKLTPEKTHNIKCSSGPKARNIANWNDEQLIFNFHLHSTQE